MTKAEINAGICGFKTVVNARMNGGHCDISITSDCSAIRRLAEVLTRVDPYREFTFRDEGPETYQLAAEYCSHAACPVPVGIIKVVELASGMALPGEVSITLTNDD